MKYYTGRLKGSSDFCVRYRGVLGNTEEVFYTYLPNKTDFLWVRRSWSVRYKIFYNLYGFTANPSYVTNEQET